MRSKKQAAAKLLALWLSGLAGQELQKIEEKLSEPKETCEHTSSPDYKKRNDKTGK